MIGADDIRAAAEATGLAFRGAFHPEAKDLPTGVAAGTIVMLGFIGGEQWRGFAASAEYRDGRPHPLDRWSHRVISKLANDLGARALFPFTAPFMPFIRWALKAEPVYPSEIGMLIHPDFGLWHAWRGALAFSDKLDLPPRDVRSRPCDSCAEKPCLTACPVSAMKGEGVYDVPTCAAHIRSSQGADCMAGGCLARRACPVGKDYQYSPEQAAFHMKSFRGG
ncbi:MAG TPA: hypothetical protein PKH09_06485 [Parvularculaceae bacterium]|nr:hypothetical protein [Parvularculaceae bacterium]